MTIVRYKQPEQPVNPADHQFKQPTTTSSSESKAQSAPSKPIAMSRAIAMKAKVPVVDRPKPSTSGVNKQFEADRTSRRDAYVAGKNHRKMTFLKSREARRLSGRFNYKKITANELAQVITGNYRPDQKRDHGRFADESSVVRDFTTKGLDKANRSKELLRWEKKSLAEVKIDPKARDNRKTPGNERLVEQFRWLNSDVGRTIQNVPGFGLADWATKNVVGSRLGHSSWVDRKTGFRYDFQASTAGINAVVGEAPGRIIETAPDGTKRELRGPNYNLFKRNCQDAGTFLNKYLPKFQSLRRKELVSKGQLSEKAEAAVTNDSVRELVATINGGPGSGNHGHKGIPGHRGGSMPSDGSMPQGVTPSARMSYSPEERREISKHSATITAKRASLLSEHAKKLHSKYKSKFLPASTDSIVQLVRAHENAASELERAAMQAGSMDSEDSVKRLEDSTWHAEKASSLRKKLERKGAISGLTRKIGKSFVKGAIGGEVDDVVESLGELGGEVTKEAAISAATGGLSAISYGSRKNANLEQQAKDIESKNKLASAPGDWAYKKAQKVREQKETTGSIASIAGQRAKKRASISLQKAGRRFMKEGISEQMGKRRRDQFANISDLPFDLGMEVVQDRRKKFREAADKYGLKTGNEGRGKGSRSRSSGDSYINSQIETHGPVLDMATVTDQDSGKRFRKYRFADGSEVQRPVANESVARLLESITANTLGNVRRERLDGREYLVVPVRMLVPGVLAGSKGPLLYPQDEVHKNYQQWNGIPLVVNHPTEKGIPVSARNPKILQKHGIGFVFNTVTAKGPLDAEGWIDVKKCQEINQGILRRLEAGQPLELSTGLFTNNVPSEGVWNNRSYQFVARDYRPDHLAILTDSVGACSLRDGCGVLVNKKNKISPQIQELIGHFNDNPLLTNKCKGKKKKKPVVNLRPEVQSLIDNLGMGGIRAVGGAIRRGVGKIFGKTAPMSGRKAALAPNPVTAQIVKPKVPTVPTSPKPLPNAGKPAVQAQIVPTARPTPRAGSAANPVQAQVVKKPGVTQRVLGAIGRDISEGTKASFGGMANSYSKLSKGTKRKIKIGAGIAGVGAGGYYMGGNRR